MEGNRRPYRLPERKSQVGCSEWTPEQPWNSQHQRHKQRKSNDFKGRAPIKILGIKISIWNSIPSQTLNQDLGRRVFRWARSKNILPTHLFQKLLEDVFTKTRMSTKKGSKRSSPREVKGA